MPQSAALQVDRRTEELYSRRLRRRILNPLYAQVTAALALQGTTVDVTGLVAVINPVFTPEILAAVSEEAVAQVLRIERQQRRKFRKSVGRILGRRRLPDRLVDTTQQVMEEAIARNVELIKTIPRRFHEVLTRDLQGLAAVGDFNKQEVAKLLRQDYGIMESRINTIANDQTVKVFQAINRDRFESIGAREYVWVTRGDDRVRPTHRANSGKRFSFDDPPPVTGNPGDDVNCRCVLGCTEVEADGADLAVWE